MLTPSAFQPLPESAPTVQMHWGAEDPYTYIDVPGDTMLFFGIRYPLDKIGVSYYGNLKFENATSAIILDAYFTYLDSLHPSAKVKYQVTGEQGDRTIVIDYQNIGMPNCAEDVRVNFQVVLSQKSGIFAINYGPSNTVCDSAFGGGGTGPYVGIFRSKLDFSLFFKIVWLSGDPLDPTITSTGLPELAGAPVSGLSYVFTPPTADVDAASTDHALKVVTNGDIVKITFSPASFQRTMEIYDILGKLAASLDIAANATEINLPALSKGVYTIRLGEEHSKVIR